MRNLDITGSRFSQIGFGEASIDYCPSKLSGSTLHIVTRGVDLSPALREPISTISSEDYIIIGDATLVFEEVVCGRLTVALYDEKGSDFIYDQNGEITKLIKEWNWNKEAEGYTYQFGGVLEWPRGSCSIELIAKGTVTIQFNSNDCIPVREY